MGNEIFLGEVGDVDFALLSEKMFRRDNQGQFILQNFGGLELRVARDERNGAEVQAIVQDFVRNVAGKHAVDAHLDARVQFAEFGKRGEKRVDGAFVHAERKFAALEAFEFGEAFFDFVAEIDEAFSVVAEKRARVGQANGAGTADEERLAERVLKLANGQADGRLRPIEALSGAGEAALFRDG